MVFQSDQPWKGGWKLVTFTTFGDEVKGHGGFRITRHVGQVEQSSFGSTSSSRSPSPTKSSVTYGVFQVAHVFFFQIWVLVVFFVQLVCFFKRCILFIKKKGWLIYSHHRWVFETIIAADGDLIWLLFFFELEEMGGIGTIYFPFLLVVFWILLGVYLTFWRLWVAHLYKSFHLPEVLVGRPANWSYPLWFYFLQK